MNATHALLQQSEGSKENPLPRSDPAPLPQPFAGSRIHRSSAPLDDDAAIRKVFTACATQERLYPYTDSNEPIAAGKKVTVSLFVRSVWALSQTNLHFKDFEASYGAVLKEIFYPVRLPVEGGK